MCFEKFECREENMIIAQTSGANKKKDLNLKLKKTKP